MLNFDNIIVEGGLCRLSIPVKGFLLCDGLVPFFLIFKLIFLDISGEDRFMDIGLVWLASDMLRDE